jgi:hypothetical protein
VIPNGNGDDGHEVLGSLPKRRPAIESPRRVSARAQAASNAAEPTPDPPDQGTRSDLADLERLAGASARLAGGAAVAGLKLAGRAAGGLGRIVRR